MDKIILVVSDIEAGDGSATDDFIADKLFSSFIDSYLARRYNEIPVELVLNGDTFDFIKSSHDGNYTRYITEGISLAKVGLFLKAHPIFFNSLKKFLKHKKNKAIFIYGNHDPDLAFKAVQKKLADILGGNIMFPGFSYESSAVRAEHGSQLDEIFKTNGPTIIRHEGKNILNLPPITYAVFEHLALLKKVYPLFERIYPKKQLLKRVPKLARILMATNTKYFLKAIYKLVKNSKNPTYKVPKGYISRIFSNIIHHNYESVFGRRVRTALKKMKGVEILIIGHWHTPKEMSIKHKKVICTGTWRDEYFISKHTSMLRSRGKYFAEVIITGDKVIGARLIKHRATNKSSDARLLDYLIEK